MEIILWGLAIISGFGILHTYLIYPAWVMRKASRLPTAQAYYDWEANKVAMPTPTELESHQQPSTFKQSPSQKHNLNLGLNHGEQPSYFASQKEINWPRVSVLMAVHNEEKVLSEKLDCLLQQDYPGPFEIYVGSDNSTDATNRILQEYAAEHQQLRVTIFPERQGKPGIINQLKAVAPTAANDHFYLLTDASVMLSPKVVTNLIFPALSRPNLSVMDARMIHTGIQQAGISQAEDHYIGREVKVKQAEGKLWGYMIGPFGGCFALRSDKFTPVPSNYLVDDFFLCLAAYEQGGRGISVPNAHCFEGVGQQLREEFRRKVRISSGNWQNMIRFHRQWLPPWGSLPFAFFSHKILRWITPFLLLLIIICLATLSVGFSNYWATLAFYSLIGLLVVPAVLDQLLANYLKLHWQPLRAIRYFIAMNLALLVGFFRFLNGIQSNVWQPSKRH